MRPSSSGKKGEKVEKLRTDLSNFYNKQLLKDMKPHG